MVLAMLNDASIQEKYNEIYHKYLEQQIDDYDNFVRSRLAEYYINTTHETVDNIFFHITKVLEEKEIEDVSIL